MAWRKLSELAAAAVSARGFGVSSRCGSSSDRDVGRHNEGHSESLGEGPFDAHRKPRHVVPPPHPRDGHLTGEPSGDSELLEAAWATEAAAGHWRAEFEWLLRHAAVRPVAARTGAEALTLRSIAGQHAAKFPLISGDADWLRSRSVAVIARRLAPLLAGGCEAALDLTSVARGPFDLREQAEQMRLVTTGLSAGLPEALQRYGLECGSLTLSASADHPGLGELLRLRSCAGLGRPQIALRVPDRLMRTVSAVSAGGAEGDDDHRLWQGVTGLVHREPGVHLVLQHTTRPTCALAGSERGDAVLPASLFEARADTAWLALDLRLDALDAPSPAESLREVRRLLRASLRLADNLVEQVDWATPELAQDALVNRRLAVHLTGIGGAVDRWQLDPAAFATVNLAVRWLGVVRRLMLRESNALARERGPFPGLELRDLESTLSRSFGGERARRMLRQAGLRHRHLLVLSPYSVFPVQKPRRPLPEYVHLLPVLRWADTIAMHGDSLARELPVAIFRRLLRLTWAIAHNRP